MDGFMLFLTTHAVDGLSDLDVKLANKMDGLFND